jgi:hypothetical protein
MDILSRWRGMSLLGMAVAGQFALGPAAYGVPLSLLSPPASAAPAIDGAVGQGEWDTAGQLALSHGHLHVQHDAGHLYLLVDLTADTHDDPPVVGSPWGDFFWLTFDVDRDAEITPNVDLNYAQQQGTYNLRLSYYLAPGQRTAQVPTVSQLGAGFGPSPASQTAHRIWEFAVDFNEIQAGPNDTVRFGLRTYSLTPSIDSSLPTNFLNDFTDLTEIQMIPEPATLLLLALGGFAMMPRRLDRLRESTGCVA